MRKYSFFIPKQFISKDINFLKEENSAKYIIKNIVEVKTHSNKSGRRSKSYNFFANKNSKFIEFQYFQEFINSDYEVRGFYAFEKIFSIANFSNRNEVSDIRTINEVRKTPFTFRKNIEKKLIGLFKYLDIDICTFDILIKDINFCLLDINPMGQVKDIYKYGNYSVPSFIYNSIIYSILCTKEKI